MIWGVLSLYKDSGTGFCEVSLCSCESKKTIRPTDHTRSLPCPLLPFTRFLAPFPGRRSECVWSCRLLACCSSKPGERIQTAPLSPCLQTKLKTGSVFKQHPFGLAYRRGTYSNSTPMASPISLPQNPSGFLSPACVFLGRVLLRDCDDDSEIVFGSAGNTAPRRL